MTKTTELIKAILVLPGTALVLVPAALLFYFTQMSFFVGLSGPLIFACRAVGFLLVAAGLLVAVQTVALFFTTGEGTPAPWAPPKKFVVSGPYAYVRNPMLLGALAVLLGVAFIFGSVGVLIWWALFWLLNTFYFRFFEEPSLVRRFGGDYLEYQKHVRRWLPRLTPWCQKKCSPTQ